MDIRLTIRILIQILNQESNLIPFFIIELNLARVPIIIRQPEFKALR